MRGFSLFSRQRWPLAALVVSLLLNGFLLGLTAVDALEPRRRWDGPRIVGFELRRLERRLSPEALAQVAAELRPQEPGFEERFAALRATRDEIYRMAAAATPDRRAIDERLAAMRTENAALQADVQRATYDALLNLPTDLRADLAKARTRDR